MGVNALIRQPEENNEEIIWFFPKAKPHACRALLLNIMLIK